MSEGKGPNIYQRMNAVMRDVRGVGKHSHNSHGRYSYAGHEAVTEALRDAYVKHGIIRTADVIQHERAGDKGGLLRLTVEVRWTNIDDPLDHVTVRTLGESPPVTSTGGAAPVQSGIALSYAVKLAEFKAFSLTGDDTPDAASEEARRYEDAAPEKPVDVAAFVAAFEKATSKKALDEAVSSFRAVMKRVSKSDTERVKAAKDKAVERMSWTDGEPQS